MKHARRVGRILGMLLLSGGGMISGAYAADTASALTADQTIACLRTAVAAYPGSIREVAVEEEKGKRFCEIKIMTEAGQKYEIYIDVATNQVVKAERD